MLSILDWLEWGTTHVLSSWTSYILWLGPWVLSIRFSLFSWKGVVYVSDLEVTHIIDTHILPASSQSCGCLLLYIRELENVVHASSSLLQELITTLWGVCCSKGIRHTPMECFEEPSNGEGGESSQEGMDVCRMQNCGKGVMYPENSEKCYGHPLVVMPFPASWWCYIQSSRSYLSPIPYQ